MSDSSKLSQLQKWMVDEGGISESFAEGYAKAMIESGIVSYLYVFFQFCLSSYLFSM